MTDRELLFSVSVRDCVVETERGHALKARAR